MSSQQKPVNKKDTTEYEAEVRDIFKLFFQASLHYRRYLLLSFLNPFSSFLSFVIMPYFASLCIAGILAQDGSFTINLLWLSVTIVVAAFSNKIGFISLLHLNANVMSDLVKRSFNVLLQRSLGFHYNNVGGKIVTHGLDLGESYSTFVVPMFTNAASIAVTTVLGLIFVFLQSALLGFYLLAIIAVLIICLYFDSRRRSRARLERHAAQKDMIAHFSDTIVNAPSVKSFAAESSEIQLNQSLSDTLRDLRLRDWTRAGTTGNQLLVFLLTSIIGLLIVFNYQASKSDVSVATGIFTLSYMLTLILRLFVITTLTRTLEEAILKAKPMTRLLQEAPEIVDAPNAVDLTVSRGEIVFDDVTFHYADADESDHVFKNLHLRIQPGEKIGLVGASGGGKTTLTRLLLRFDDIQSGSIAIDGQDIARHTQTSLREAISYVPQEPLLFHRSIRENIAYAHPDASDSDVIAAAKKAHAHEFIKALPHGYDTLVGERGVKLSGGQRQRVAIARAILKDAPILVLDEATSALDSESEQAVQAALTELMKGRTTLVIAHRLSTIQAMDRIVVFDKGAIREQGSHAELLEQKGTYAKLWRHQSGGFIKED